MPLLSIIITVYNLENYIEECLESVINQDIEDYEIILVDNASTDGSREICKAYEEKYRQIKFIGIDGESIIGRAHSVGIAEASGKYIHMLDGDDYVEKGCYSDIIRIIKENKPDVIIGKFISTPEIGAKHINDAIIDSKKINNINYEEALRYIMGIPNFHMVQWRYIFKRSIYLMPDETKDALYSKKIFGGYYGDVITSTRILIKARSIYCYDKPFYYYRIRVAGAITSEITQGHYRGFFSTIFRLCFLLKKLNCKEVRKEYVFSRIRIMFKLFSSGIDLIDHKESNELAKIIDDNWDYFTLLKEIEDADVRTLYNFVSTDGSYEGIRNYCIYKNAKLISKLSASKANDVYVLPGGHYGEATARTIKNQGINVCGFLDNDEFKSEKEIMNIKCYLPVYLTNLTEEQLNNTIVVISTIYDELENILKEQILSLGISEEKIIIRE